MWAFAVIAVMVAALGSFMSRQADGERTVSAAHGREMAERVSVYRHAVVTWARTQPHFEGPVDESAVATPGWWRSHPSLGAVIEGKVVAVYLTEPQPKDVLGEMLRLARGSIWVGYASRETGTLHSPTIGDTGIALPAAVPDQAPVWLALRD
jgi:hypothetical protein